MGISIQEVYHEQFGKIRVVVIKGVCYFVGKDAAMALRFRDPDQALRMHVQAQDKCTFSSVKATGQIENEAGIKIPHNAILINESGLWSLVMRSKLPKAREFQHWMTSEVIPQIVRTGSYNAPANTAPTSEFTKREKLDILIKLLNLNLPAPLRNQVVRQILLVISDEYEIICEKLAQEI